MPIPIVCPKGHKLSAQDNLAGKQVRCPKCGSPIRIPAPSDLVEKIPEAQPAPNREMADLPNIDLSSMGEIPSFDPFSPSTSDPFNQISGMELPASQPVPQSYPSYQATATVATKPSHEVTSKNWPLLIGAATAGVVCGLSFTGLLGWMLLGGPSNEENLNKQRSQANLATVVAPTSPVASEATPPPSAENNSASPATNAATTDLRRIELDERLMGFDLPGLTWASAYDEASGHLVVTNDEKGALIYDLDDVLQGSTAIKSAFPTDGIPTAVCQKQLDNRRVFVIAGKDSSALQLIDADTLEQLGKVSLQNVLYVDFLTASMNPKDPFVYFSTANYDSTGRQVGGRLGRVDLVTGKQDGFSKGLFIDATLSQDGSTIYARTESYSGSNTRVGGWKEFTTFDQKELSQLHGGLSYGESIPYLFSNTVAINQLLFTPSLGIKVGLLDYVAGGEFRSRPVLFGIANDGVVFGSANNGRRHDVVPLPEFWMRDGSSSQSNEPRDFRQRYGISPVVKSGYCNILADDQRSIGLAVLSERIIVAPTNKVNIPTEPNLQPRSVLPQSVSLGDSLALALATADPNTEFEYVPNTDWLVDEKTPLLGEFPLGEHSPSSLLKLQRSVSPEDVRVRLVDNGHLGTRLPPFKLRIGNEIMEVTAIENDGALLVTRTQNFIYASDARIAVVDDSGKELDPKPPAPPIIPEGKRLLLVADIGSQQNIVFVNSLKPLRGERFPVPIQIGDEKMNVVSVDDFKTQLNVERINPVRHSITSEAFVLSNEQSAPEPAKNLPIFQGAVLKWTPSFDQLGKQNIRLRARSGSVTHDWFWETDVKSGTVKFPFQLAGIDVEKGTSLAVVWGQSALPILALNAGSITAPQPLGMEYFIGVYDVANKKLLRHAKVPKPIACATMHIGQIVVCLNHSMAQLVRLDAQTLKETARVDISNPCTRVEVIGGKYIYGSIFNRYPQLRFTFPELKAIEPLEVEYNHPIAGRIRDRWVWEGVVWNEQMTKPQLLLYPVHFETRSSAGRYGPGNLFNEKGFAKCFTQGPFVSAWFPVSANGTLDSNYLFNDYPGGATCTNFQLQSTSWAESSLATADNMQPTKSLPLVSQNELERLFRSHFPDLDRRGMHPDMRESLGRGHVSEDEQHVYVALLGELFAVNKKQLFTPHPFFRFEEKQDTFILSGDKPNKVRYSAQGASNYRLQLWFIRPGHFDETPNISLESEDGAFEIYFDPLFVAQRGLILVKTNESSVANNALSVYAKKITPFYKQLTGKPPRTVCVPVYVLVVADHEDKKQRAALAHSYLVEVPIKPLQGLMKGQ